MESRDLGDDILRLQVSSRLSRQAGMSVSLYLVGDLLIDTGFSHARDVVLAGVSDALAGRPLRAIACTHHHEDHTGNAAALAAALGAPLAAPLGTSLGAPLAAPQQGCPVYLRHPEQRRSEGVGVLPAYRQVYWGPAPDYAPRPMPDVLRLSGGDARGVGDRVLQVVPTPGHSATHVVFFEPRARVVFSGDLIVSSGASAIMAHESPDEIARSLRRVAALEPRRLLSGHGLILEDPAARLRLKAERIECAASAVRALHHRGAAPAEIAHRIFRGGWARERWGAWMTRGEFSRLCFVRAVLRDP